MKKSIIISIILITLSLIGLLAYSYISSFHNVEFVVKQTNLTVDVYNKSNDKKITSITTSGSKISLKSGEYYYIAVGEKVSNEQNNITVGKYDQEVTVDPDYSAEYIASLVASEAPKINAIISAAYPDIISGYNISTGQMYKKGEWYGTIIKKKIDSWDVADSYRILLHREGESWKIVRYPELILTTNNYPDVPIEVLRSVNELANT